MPKAIINAKEKILDAARVILEEQGYEYLNIRDIAGRCSIGLGTVYNYYSSKEEIVKDIMVNEWIKTLTYMDVYCDSKYEILDSLNGIFVELRKFVIAYKDIWMTIYMHGEKDSRTENTHYNEADFYSALKSKISEILNSHKYRGEKQEFIESFIAKNFAMYSIEPDFDFDMMKNVLKKILV